MAGLALVAALGCDAGDKRKPKKIIPVGPYIVLYECSHSMEPWGRGGAVRNIKVDLAAKQQELLDYEYSGEPTPTPEPEHKPVVTPLTDSRVAAIQSAVVAALSGGPYKQELPVPEGTPCTLTIRDTTARELLRLEKAYTKEPDAASELVKAVAGSVE